MKLWIIKDKNHSKVYYRFLKCFRGSPWGSHVQSTAVKERAALFLDMSAAQDVADELFIAGYKEYVVASFDGE